MRCVKKEEGFVLLTVIILVAVITSIIYDLVYKQFIDTKRSTAMSHQSQALILQWGAESWVKKELRRDKDKNNFDYKVESWSQPLPPVDFNGGSISGFITDKNACLNINNLAIKGRQGEYWSESLIRILNEKGIEFDSLDGLKDWIDKDSEPRALGAEKNDYLLESPPYQAANFGLLSLNELKVIKGFKSLSDKELKDLSTSVCTLPGSTKVNINTAPEELIHALIPGLSDSVILSWIKLRELAPAHTINDFYSALKTVGSTENALDKIPIGVLSVSSDYFMLNSFIRFGDMESRISTLLLRNGKRVGSIGRWQL